MSNRPLLLPDPPASPILPVTSDATKRLGKTTEFWLALIAAILIPANDVLELGLPVESIVGVIAMVIAYATSRGLAKTSGEKIRAGVRTAEFWTAVISSVVLLLAEKFGVDLTPEQVTAFVAMIASLTIGRGATKRAGARPSSDEFREAVEKKLADWRAARGLDDPHAKK